MKWLKKKAEHTDKVESRVQDSIDLIKDLDKTEFKRLVKAMELFHEGYMTVRKIKEIQEKEGDIVDAIETEIEKLK